MPASPATSACAGHFCDRSRAAGARGAVLVHRGDRRLGHRIHRRGPSHRRCGAPICGATTRPIPSSTSTPRTSACSSRAPARTRFPRPTSTSTVRPITLPRSRSSTKTCSPFTRAVAISSRYPTGRCRTTVATRASTCTCSTSRSPPMARSCAKTVTTLAGRCCPLDLDSDRRALRHSDRRAGCRTGSPSTAALDALPACRRTAS